MFSFKLFVFVFVIYFFCSFIFIYAAIRGLGFRAVGVLISLISISLCQDAVIHSIALIHLLLLSVIILNASEDSNSGYTRRNIPIDIIAIFFAALSSSVGSFAHFHSLYETIADHIISSSTSTLFHPCFNFRFSDCRSFTIFSKSFALDSSNIILVLCLSFSS